MIEHHSLKQFIHQAMHCAVETTDCVKLAGDASNRAYYRVSWQAGGITRTAILMVMAQPEAFKSSEEAVSGGGPSLDEPPFISIQRHLLACKIAVPEIYAYDAQRGWILLEDLGDLLFSDVVDGQVTPVVMAYYQKAIDTLIDLQLRATLVTSPNALAHGRAFDAPLFIWEFDHFIEYGIEARGGLSLPERPKAALREFFSEIAFRLAALPQVFTHRDYHSRNLLVQKNPAGRASPVDSEGVRIRVIDFQDALMGPCQYDLASLLRDSYIDLPDADVKCLVAYYLSQWEARTGQKMAPDMFYEFFDLVSIQRNLKAAGRFVYIDQVKKNPRFLCYVAPTLAKVRRNLKKYPRLATLHQMLADYVEELR